MSKQQEFIIGEFQFDTFHEYRDGQEDVKKIEYINRELDIHDPEVAVRLYNDIRTGVIKFKSPIGDQFFAHLADIVADKSVDLLEDKAVIEEAEGKVKYQKVLGLVCVGLAVICFGVFGILEVKDYISAQKAKERIEKIQLEQEQSTKEEKELPEQTTENPWERTNIDPATLTILPEYQDLYHQNNEMIGWIQVVDTPINYPVMQKPLDNEFYLWHNFEKEEDRNGTIFMDYRSDAVNETTNTILYGHNRKTGMMFGSLKEYLDPEYYQSHQQIIFSTLYEHREYQVVALCMSEVKYQDENDYRYYNFIHANNDAEFDAFLSNIKSLSVYGDDISLSKTDKILTLSTCNSYTDDGRLFIVAKRIK